MVKVNNDYDDIIDMPHHQSKTHPHMSIHDRAAQFGSFAALTGHKDMIKETEQLAEMKIDSENEKIDYEGGDIYE